MSFTAGYGDERVIAQLFLPRTGRPPYQTVVFFPGSDAIGRDPRTSTTKDLRSRSSSLPFSSRVAQCSTPSTRAHTRETAGRQDYYEALHVSGDPTQEYADYQVMIVRDVRRSLDYLASRSDIDSRRLVFEGFSWGGFVAPMVLASNRVSPGGPRPGGFDPWMQPRPEVDR